MKGFSAAQVLPDVWHIADCMGVCMTLITGRERALLVDAGYGMENVEAFVRTMTDLPLTVLMSHAHHDHILGARWFAESRMLRADVRDFSLYTSRKQRQRVMEQAAAKGITPPADYLTAPIPVPRGIEPCVLELGGLTARIMACPGHTPGSAVVFVPQRQLLLTADNWNPCTWLFFEQALPVEQYRANLRRLLHLPFAHVLCSHQPALYERAALERFLEGIGDEALAKAHPVQMGVSADTREIFPAPGMNLVFDWGKSALCGKESGI